MTIYNDGKWNGWNGGECPVHPKTEVDAVFGDGGKQCSIAGSHLDWSGPDVLPRSYVAAFRVVTPYIEPRTMWAVGKHLHDTLVEAEAFCAQLDAEYPGRGYGKLPIIKMVEVAP